MSNSVYLYKRYFCCCVVFYKSTRPIQSKPVVRNRLVRRKNFFYLTLVNDRKKYTNINNNDNEGPPVARRVSIGYEKRLSFHTKSVKLFNTYFVLNPSEMLRI